jgi:hypothetical protein
MRSPEPQPGPTALVKPSQRVAADTGGLVVEQAHRPIQEANQAALRDTARVQRSFAGAAGIATAVIALFVAAGCEGPGPHADQQLQRLNRVAVLHAPPPGGHLIGRGQDRGNNSGIDGYAPEIVAIFGSSQDAETVANYYRTQYPEYHLSTDFPRAPGTIQMVGTEGPSIIGQRSAQTAVIGIDIDPAAPHNETHVAIPIPKPGPDDRTYIVIDVQGHCECNN